MDFVMLDNEGPCNVRLIYVSLFSFSCVLLPSGD